MEDCHVQEVEKRDRQGQKHRPGDQPLEAYIAEGDLPGGGIVISVRWTLRVRWSIKNQMVAHVATAQEADLPAMQKPVQKVAQKFGHSDGSCEPCENGDYVFHHSRTLGQPPYASNRQAASRSACRDLPPCLCVECAGCEGNGTARGSFIM